MIYDIEPKSAPHGHVAQVECQGGKNHFNHCASVAAIAGDDFDLTLRNTPEISDRGEIQALLEAGGLSVTMDKSRMRVVGPDSRLAVDLRGVVKRTRVSICYAAGYAAVRGSCIAPYPRGDAFTPRPIDIHMNALIAAGANITHRENSLFVSFQSQPTSFELDLRGPYGPSLGASISALLIAAVADGTSVLQNISPEPEVKAVIRILQSYGVPIDLLDHATISVDGMGGPLAGQAVEAIEGDRCEAVTYILMAAARRVPIDLIGIDLGDLPPTVHASLKDLGVHLTGGSEGRVVGRFSDVASHRRSTVTTGVHPRFPTDMNPLVAAFACLVPGYTEVNERVYRDRTSHVTELRKLGLEIGVQSGRQIIHGAQRPRTGVATVRDVRCGAAIMIAAAAAGGSVRMLDREGHLARGYSHLPRKLAAVGLSIKERRSA